MFQNHDVTFDGGMHAAWPPLPWIAMVLFRWIFIPRNKGWWRFAPCDSYMQPRELPFAKE